MSDHGNRLGCRVVGGPVHDQTAVDAIQELYVPVGIGSDLAASGVAGVEAIQVGPIFARAFPSVFMLGGDRFGKLVTVVLTIEALFPGKGLAAWTQTVSAAPAWPGVGARKLVPRHHLRPPSYLRLVSEGPSPRGHPRRDSGTARIPDRL